MGSAAKSEEEVYFSADFMNDLTRMRSIVVESLETQKRLRLKINAIWERLDPTKKKPKEG